VFVGSIAAARESLSSSSSDGQQTCRFRFQSDMVTDDIVSATFGIYIRQAAHTSQRPHMATWVLVYALWAAAAPDQPPERHLVHRRRIYLDDRDTGRWHHFSFLSQVRRWVAEPDTNQGLFVQATDSRGEPLAVIQPINNEEQPYVKDLRSIPYDCMFQMNVIGNPSANYFNWPVYSRHFLRNHRYRQLQFCEN